MLLSFESRRGSKQFAVFFLPPPLPKGGVKANPVPSVLSGPWGTEAIPAGQHLQEGGGCPAPAAGRSWPPYLLSPGLGPCSSMPAVEGTVPPPVLLSALELWGGGSGPAGAKVLPSVGGSGGWKAGDMCFLFRVPPRRWAWKSISFTPKLHRENKQSTHHAPPTDTEAHRSTRVNPTRGDSHPSRPACSEAARTGLRFPATQASDSTGL